MQARHECKVNMFSCRLHVVEASADGQTCCRLMRADLHTTSCRQQNPRLILLPPKALLKTLVAVQGRPAPKSCPTFVHANAVTGC